MNEESRHRLRSALAELTPSAEDLSIPELRSSRRREHLLEVMALAVACLLAAVVIGSLLWLHNPSSSSPASGVNQPRPAATHAPTGAPATATTPPGPAQSQAPGVVPSASASSAPTDSRCHTSDLSASLRGLNPAAGQRYAALALTNQSGHACQVYGYVGMLLLDQSRNPVPTNVVRNAAPGPQVVDLQPGQSAFTVLHWTVVTGTGDFPSAQCEPQPAYVEVTPPDETTQLVTGWNLDVVCLRGRIDLGALSPGTGPSY